jgi:hypothetical protein
MFQLGGGFEVLSQNGVHGAEQARANAWGYVSDVMDVVRAGGGDGGPPREAGDERRA